MTREHLFFIPFIFFLGLVVGALAMRERPVGARGGRWVALAGLLVVLVFVATHALSMHGGARHTEQLLGGQPLFDQHPSFTAREVYDRIAGFGVGGREAYRKMTYTSDVVFPLVLCLFLFSLARHVAQTAPKTSLVAANLLPMVPLLWLAADLAENAIVYTLLRTFPAPSDGLAGVLGTVTDLKFTLLVASVAAPAVAMLRARAAVRR